MNARNFSPFSSTLLLTVFRSCPFLHFSTGDLACAHCSDFYKAEMCFFEFFRNRITSESLGGRIFISIIHNIFTCSIIRLEKQLNFAFEICQKLKCFL